MAICETSSTKHSTSELTTKTQYYGKYQNPLEKIALYRVSGNTHTCYRLGLSGVSKPSFLYH